MRFCIFRKDVPGSAPQRHALRQGHLDHLRQHHAAILFAGPLRAPGTGEEAGSLYLVDFKSLEEACEFVRQDPFTQAGLFSLVEIHPFTPTYGPLQAALDSF